MNIRYPNLLSPLKVGNMVLKNRMTSAPSTPHFLQGTETHYTEKMSTDRMPQPLERMVQPL